MEDLDLRVILHRVLYMDYSYGAGISREDYMWDTLKSIHTYMFMYNQIIGAIF